MPESSTMKLLVYAIVALAALAFFYQNFAELFQIQTDSIKDLMEGIELAELNKGEVFSKKITFKEAESIGAKLFDNESRGVVFKCLDFKECCPIDTSDCNLKVQDRRIVALNNSTIETNFRCFYDVDLFVCKVYFGKEPAQVLFSNINLSEKLDLSQDTSIAKLVIENTGELEAKDIIVSAKIYSLSTELGNEVKTLYSEKINKKIDSLSPNSSQEVELDLGITDFASFEVEFSIESEDSGLDKTTRKLETTGDRLLGCETADYGVAKRVEGRCLVEHFCSGCESSIDCSLAWLSKGVVQEKIIDRYPDHIIVEIDDTGCFQII